MSESLISLYVGMTYGFVWTMLVIWLTKRLRL